MIDPGSTISIITHSLLSKLQFTPDTQNIEISGIGGIVKSSNKVVSLKVCSRVYSDCSINVNCCILEKITERCPLFMIDRTKLNIPHDIELADPTFYEPSSVDILLGADVYYKILVDDTIKINHLSLTLVGTQFGYLLSGLVPSQVFYRQNSLPQSLSNNCFFVQVAMENSSMNSLLERFWSVEDIPQPPEKLMCPEDSLVEKIFCETTITLENGSFQVDLPFKTPKENFPLGQSFFLARKRFFHLENRFMKHPELFQDYKKFIDEYISLNHARVVPLSLDGPLKESKYFFPHHCVIKNESTSTKLRVVFDGSMKTSSGLSLNDTLYKGYTVQPELFDILIRFRSFKCVLTADIEKMYRQIRVNPKHTHLQNILWRDIPSDDLQNIELLTVTYGTNCAPFLATRVLKELAQSHKDEFPFASDALLNQCYVDDTLCGQDSMEELIELHDQLVNLCKLGNFNLHKWCSNSNGFMDKIYPNKFQNKSQENYDIQSDGNSNKVLGIYWNPNIDVFSISLPDISSLSSTKREVLSKISQMFDPLGLIGPVILTAKLIMQEIWKAHIGWDDPLNETLSKQWNVYLNHISLLKSLPIPRYLLSNNDFLHIELHGFCDASRKAYGACVYVRAVYPDNLVTCNLITSKSRVAPIKEVTIPRLELCGSLLLSNLISRIIEIFKKRFSFNNVHVWTDSEIVLSWINSHPSKYNVFVANRISQIQTLTQKYLWHHIPTQHNPADCISRGLTPYEIINSSLWWHGPEFLLDPNLNLKEFTRIVEPTSEEQKQVKKVLLITQDNCWISTFEKFSQYSKLQRSFAFLFRFLHNSRFPSRKMSGPISVSELRKAEVFILKHIQASNFSKEIVELNIENGTISNKQILKLSPFLDSNGLIKVGGRLSQSPISYDHKFPILLPARNHVVKLLLIKEHIRLGHAGPQTVLSNIRLRYWPLNGLKEIKRISIQCFSCSKFKVKSFQQIMADLPKDRVTPARPFSKTGVDFAGPLFVKSSTLRSAKVEKAYIAVFVCMVTKAVHLELVSSLSTAAFLACLKRFIARRRNPSVIYSDNGTNFLGACNQIHDLYKLFKDKGTQEEITNCLSKGETEWKFIPPHSPHWGGLWEAAVKSCKHHLKRLLGEQHFSFEEISTVLCQIEAILNSRPLQPLSSDPSDLNCLTPGHFLIGTPLTSYPEVAISDIPENRLTRWQRCTKVQQLFWSRWIKEYLNQLQCRPKWMCSSNNVGINDVVLLKEDNTKPLEWPLARVLEILPSADGKVRLVKIKTKDTILTRNITKLCPLPNYDQPNL